MTLMDRFVAAVANRVTLKDIFVKRFVYGKPWLPSKFSSATSGWKNRTARAESGCAACQKAGFPARRTSGYDAPAPIQENVETRTYQMPGTFQTIESPIRYDSLPPVYYGNTDPYAKGPLETVLSRLR